MNCPFCNLADTKVLDSRPDAEGRSVRRRRECLTCHKRWRTVEQIEDEMPLVIKKNGTFQPFDRLKLMRSVEVACGKRPVTKSRMEKLIADIEWQLLESTVDTVTSTDLGEMVMEGLKKVDEIAYIRFASVYRRFKDVGELMAEVEDLLQEQVPS
jgi:transcriptional repressor NrdR